MKLIYVLRSQCDICGLDKMNVFYRVPNATPKEMFDGHKKLIRKRFPEKYGCHHTIRFTKEVDKTYKYDEVNNVLVKR